MTVERIGIDLAKDIFQIHIENRAGKLICRRKLRRTEMINFFANRSPSLIGMEACGGAHYWARRLREQGHDVRLIAPQFVAPYRKSEKNDSNDAQAICEAVGRPSMRFVAVKTAGQQAVLALHAVRERVVKNRTAAINQARGLLAEFGIVVAQGADKLRKHLPLIIEDAENSLTSLARELFNELYQQIVHYDQQVKRYDERIQQLAKQDCMAQKLMTVGGVGPLTATALIATVGDAKVFDNGRQLAAWLGMVPRQFSSGGKAKHGRITKRGDAYVRKLLVHGARSEMCRIKGKTDNKSLWAKQLKERRGFNKATVALAAKHARILWSLMTRAGEYIPTHA